MDLKELGLVLCIVVELKGVGDAPLALLFLLGNWKDK